MAIKKVLIGDTIRFTWVSSGANPSSIVANVFDKNETLVGSGTLTSSGNGHYYYNYTLPNTMGYYVGEVNATINSLNYKRKTKFKAVSGEVD